MSAWVSVKDRLPDIDGGVLVTDGENITAASLFRYGVGKWVWSTHEVYGYDSEIDWRDNITHWMPLPPLPAISDTTEQLAGAVWNGPNTASQVHPDMARPHTPTPKE